ncbi:MULTISPECIES: iron-containing alcohol dehydrogenase [unclassified Mesorhizobium]|jgi:alcohol dehydrogenase class IV|uniref:iron-containing alcohol dehydrogenase n=4 Tax=Mesorhizobium TaxID=68287 RepID=UPI000FDBAD9D|nr:MULTISPECIES: iron-containing alcohol dehydrogenase [unclassified Mesorhizobium]AZV23453.1 iron-containing alcohol dehydrogenase [Mesorhizobium sp. M7A.F.Ce.TU.012.03.2.1]RWB08342.1 MAG: iron-containing alcohol dehydrogenase [Mesorhizobium sp.]RWB15985.1 MAG: iron-containing alcohol dehydrogenase [Mesorhizobium sp.]RWN18142.1 MAG: iron-containing alcohol dehydrogenase [Mesorhizobium sp.]RWN93500.1 MAG: iron-containing alcohol dehydrogenase [Mesorhizobium sp.]
MTLFAALRLPREILFGKGQRHVLPTVAARFGRRALVCTDERFAGTAVFADIIKSLQSASIEVLVHDRVLPDVPRDTVGICVEEAKGFRPDMVIGIGGGSCLDFAKCTTLLLSHGGKLQDYYGEFKVPGPTLPLIAVPTTAGTGSEVTPVAVISDPDRTLKVGISSPHLIAAVALCDPELTMTCPPGLTAIAGADALTHAIEAFTAMRRGEDPNLPQQHVFIGKTALTDHFALLAIKLLGRSLEKACSDGTDADARADVMMGALAAGCAFGTAGTAAAHAVQYPAGALTHTAHGLGVATMMPYVMTYNSRVAAHEMAEIGAALGLETKARTAAEMAAATIEEIRRLFAAIGITPTLADLGLPADKLDWTAEQALGIDRLIKNNPRAFDLGTMRRLVQAAHDGDLAACVM